MLAPQDKEHTAMVANMSNARHGNARKHTVRHQTCLKELHSFVVLYILSAGLLLPACLLDTWKVVATHQGVFVFSALHCHGMRAVCVISLASCDRRDVL